MTTSSNSLQTGYGKVEQIPVMWVLPEKVTPQCKLVIWLAGGFSKMETVLPILELLALVGYVAVSFDSWERGSRATEEPDVVATRAWANFPLVAFPLLGNGALEVLRVVDWAAKEFNLSAPFAVDGRSLAGDIAVAAAGLDPRIACVAAIVATPDWKRPGMHVDGVLIGEGQPDAYASYFYNRINPITNPRSYAHCPAILFECGAKDDHVPPDGALRFQKILADVYGEKTNRIRVNLHPNLGHGSVPKMMDNCLAWFQKHI
jgi:uncharacterized protein